MTEEEEFEFRLRLEREKAGKPQEIADQDTKSNIPAFNLARESGLVKGYLDPAAGGAQLIDKIRGTTSIGGGMDIDKFIEREEAAYQKRRGDEGESGVDWARIGGNILSPPSLAAMGAPTPAGYLPKVFQGMKTGAGFASLQPVEGDDYWEKKKRQVMTGTTVGGVVPAIATPAAAITKRVFDAGKRITRPLRHKGRVADVHDTYKTIAGDRREKIVEALDSAKEGQTSAQAIAAANRRSEDVFGAPVVRLEKDLSKKTTIADELASVYKKQELGRKSAIRSIKGTEDDMARAVAERSKVTAPLYDLVDKSEALVDITPVATKIDEVIAKNINDDAIVAPLSEIKKKLSDVSPRALHSLSKHIKRLMGKTTDGKNNYDVGVLDDIKSILDDQIGIAEPTYNLAREEYARLSAPINQMKVGDELYKALTSPSEAETAPAFLGAMRNAPRTMKRSTGFSRYKELGDVLPDEKVSDVKKVADELLTGQEAKRMSSKVSGVLSDVSTQAKPQLPNALVREVMVANHLLKRLAHKDYGNDYQKLILELQLNPQKLAEVLRDVPEPEIKRAILGIIKQSSIIGGVSEANQMGER